MMRRLARLSRLSVALLFLAGILAVDLANIWPLADHSVAAQPPFTFGLNSQGIIQYSTASISAVNTTAAVALWSSTVPGPFTATSANANWSPSSVATPPPLHLLLQGSLSTNIATGAPGTINIGVNYGGGVTGVASLALANAYSPVQNLGTVPVQIDVWMSPVATATNSALPGAQACFFYLSSRLTIATAAATGVAGASPIFLDAHTCSSTGGGFLASAEQLNVLMNWASASTVNSLTIYRGVLMYGM